MKRSFWGKKLLTMFVRSSFSAVGIGLRKRRSMPLSRALGFEALRRRGLEATARMVASHFTMKLLGVEAVHGRRVQLRRGGLYLIVYRNRGGEVSFRTVTVLGRSKGRIVALCHLKQEIKHFVRSRILHAEPL